MVAKMLCLLIIFVLAVIVLCGCDVEPKRERHMERPVNPVLDAPILKNSR